MAEKNVQRLPAEELYQRELDALISAEEDPIPTGWRMSPRSVRTYITGGVSVKGWRSPQSTWATAAWWRLPSPLL